MPLDVSNPGFVGGDIQQRSLGDRMNDPYASPQERAEAWQELQMARNRGRNQPNWQAPGQQQQQQQQQQWAGFQGNQQQRFQQRNFGAQPLMQQQPYGLPQVGNTPQQAQPSGLQAFMAMLPMLQQARAQQSGSTNPIISMLGGGGGGGNAFFGGQKPGGPMNTDLLGFNDVRSRYLQGARFQ